METIGNYIFWTSVYFAITAIVFALLVSKTANPTQNRWFIIGSLLASLFFAAVGQFGPGLPAGGSAPGGATLLPEVIVDASAGAYAGLEITRQNLFNMFATSKIIPYVIITVSLLVFLRMLGSLLYLASRLHLNRREKIDGCTVLSVREKISPFSFFGCVFIPEDLLNRPQLKQIILHERAHIQKLHSIDLIFIEFLTVFFWFHPAIWYLRKELKNQHEYEADRFVLECHEDKVSYQKLLLDISFPGFSLSVTNPFNYPSLKKRIMMMNKKFSGSGRRALISMLIAVPLFVAALFIHSCNFEEDKAAVDAELAETAKAADYSDDVVFTIVEMQPAFPGGEVARVEFLQENLTYPESAKNEGAQGIVFVSFVVRYDGALTDTKIIRGLHPDLDAEVLRVVNLMPTWEPGRQRDKDVSTQFVMPVRFTLN
jgi:TonB family protein